MSGITPSEFLALGTFIKNVITAEPVKKERMSERVPGIKKLEWIFDIDGCWMAHVPYRDNPYIIDVDGKREKEYRFFCETTRTHFDNLEEAQQEVQEVHNDIMLKCWSCYE